MRATLEHEWTQKCVLWQSPGCWRYFRWFITSVFRVQGFRVVLCDLQFRVGMYIGFGAVRPQTALREAL